MSERKSKHLVNSEHLKFIPLMSYIEGGQPIIYKWQCTIPEGMQDWLKKYCKGEWQIDRSGGGLLFSNRDDAIMFKMFWNNKDDG